MTPALQKSDSVASNKTSSTAKSYISIRHPFGILRLVRHDDHDDQGTSVGQQQPSFSHAAVMNHHLDDEELPPLQDPETTPAQTRDNSTVTTTTTESAPHGRHSLLDRLSHQDLHKTQSSTSLLSLRHAVGDGDIILILDLPEMFTVGYDSLTLTAKSFRGIRDFPNGPHFIWVAPPGGVSTRSGCWLHTTGDNRVHVLQWDRYNEVLTDAGHSEARFQSQDIADIYPGLWSYSDPTGSRQGGTQHGPSAAMQLQIWEQLTGAVTNTVASGTVGHSDVGHYFVHTTDMARGARVSREEQAVSKRLSSAMIQNKELKFVFAQDDRIFRTDRTGRDRTVQATDATSHIHALLESHQRKHVSLEHLLGGEFQLAFVTGMHLGNDACIQQWWYMLNKLILKAYGLVVTHPQVAAALLRTIAAQFTYNFERLETSFLDYSSDFKGRDLRLGLTVYKRRLDEYIHPSLGTPRRDAVTPDHVAVATAFAKVEAIVGEHLDWDLTGSYVRKGRVTTEDGEELELELADLEGEDERGEYAPTVVTLDDAGRQSDLISWSS